MSITEVFPALGLRITAGPLELRGIVDDDLAKLGALAERGIHEPAAMPFYHPWTQVIRPSLPLNSRSTTGTAGRLWSRREVGAQPGRLARRRAARRPGRRHRALPGDPHGRDRLLAGASAPGAGDRHRDATDDLCLSLRPPRLRGDHLGGLHRQPGVTRGQPQGGLPRQRRTTPQATRGRAGAEPGAWCSGRRTSSAANIPSRSRAWRRSGGRSGSIRRWARRLAESPTVSCADGPSHPADAAPIE